MFAYFTLVINIRKIIKHYIYIDTVIEIEIYLGVDEYAFALAIFT
jgi:hypothetical protein